MLQLVESGPLTFWDALYVVPVIVVAGRGGVRLGLTAAALAIVLVAAGAQLKGVDLGLTGYASRACTFLLASAVVTLPFGRGSPVEGPAPSGLADRQRETLELAELGTWELDLATGAMTWSDEYFALYGVDPQVFTSREAFDEIVHPDDRDVLTNTIKRIVEDGVVAEVRYRILRPSDGAERCIRSHVRCERDTSGRPRVVLGTGQDVTDLVLVLSPREREMLMLLAEGLSGEQIAARLTLSPATVRTHINNAMIKLGAHTRGQAIAIALRSDEIGS